MEAPPAHTVTFGTCFDFLIWAPQEYFLPAVGALRAAPLDCKLSPISARSPGYEPLSWFNFRRSGARSRPQTKTQTGSCIRVAPASVHSLQHFLSSLSLPYEPLVRFIEHWTAFQHSAHCSNSNGPTSFELFFCFFSSRRI